MSGQEFRCALLTDGTSDEILRPIIEWVFQQKIGYAPIVKWIDFRRIIGFPPDLSERIVTALDLYPCQVLFIHRDAEKEKPEVRFGEVQNKIEETRRKHTKLTIPPHVCVVPIRMTEAWLLFDEAAIRRAAGNPIGKEKLGLPKLNRVEALPDPKDVLHKALCTASGLTGRRLNRFSVGEAARNLADHIQDYSPLRQLSAFQRFESDVEEIITRFELQ